MAISSEALPDDIEALKRLLRARDAELAQARAEASNAEALIAHLRLSIEKMRREVYGQRSERSARLLGQMELELEELEAAASEDELAAEQAATAVITTVGSFRRRKPSRKPFPEHLPRERCKFAGNSGSDSISMKLLGGLALFSRRNQRHAHQISDFVPGPEGPRRGQRQACRRNDRRDRPGRSPYRRLPAVRSCVAARSQPLYPAGVGSALFRSKDSPSRCHAPVCLQRAPLPAQDLRRALR